MTALAASPSINLGGDAMLGRRLDPGPITIDFALSAGGKEDAGLAETGVADAMIAHFPPEAHGLTDEIELSRIAISLSDPTPVAARLLARRYAPFRATRP